MAFEDLLLFANAIIKSIEPDSLSDETLAKLHAIFPKQLVVAALDIIDHGNVIHYVTPWGHTEYEVIGSTATYSILLDIKASPIPYSCSCPAFVYSVLISDTHIMCKHVLATLIARKMNLCETRPASADDLAAIFIRQFPLPDKELPSG